jgi:restriction system protein
MTPREYEEVVAAHFRSLGFTTELTPYSNDYGVDVFARRDGEKIAVQAKMYGAVRRVNREMVMQLHGAKDYFDCTSAVIVTDGEVAPDATEVAAKLRIAIQKIPATRTPYVEAAGGPLEAVGPTTRVSFFENIWQTQIVPLVGKTLVKRDGDTNRIVRVDWTGITRITSSGHEQFIPIEVFRRAVQCIEETGCVTRAQINEGFAKRASSGVVLILSQVREIEHLLAPSRLVMRSS